MSSTSCQIFVLLALFHVTGVASRRPPAPDDPFPNPDKESRNPWAHLNRPKSRDFIIDQSSAPKRPVFANATRDNCLWIRGRVFCSNSANEHNGRTAVAYFVDSSKGRIDETYTSKNGLFSVFGCSPHSFATSDVYLELMHDCKTPNNGSTSVKFLMPYTNQKEINITDVINLSAHYSDEEKIKSTDFRVPCDPF